MTNKKLKVAKTFITNYLTKRYKDAKKLVIKYNFEKQYCCLNILIEADIYTNITDRWSLSLMGGDLDYLHKYQHYYVNSDFSITSCIFSNSDQWFITCFVDEVSDFLKNYEKIR